MNTTGKECVCQEMMVQQLKGKGMEDKEREDIDEKKAYLKSYEKSVRQMQRHAERITEMRLNRMGAALRIDGMPHSHNSSDLSSYAVMLDEEERKYMRERYKRIVKCKEITDKIERMSDEDEKDVLLYRYIRLMKWEDIAVKMGHSWQHIHKIHARALKNFKIR